MRIAFGIVSLFPGGGLQRDCVEIARMVRDAGCDVVIYTARLTGTMRTGDVPIVVIPNAAKTNHGRHQRFAVDFLSQASRCFDLIVGFDKLFGLDVLYCGDRSIHYRLLKHPYLHLLPRYRTYSRIESDSFKRGQKTRIMMLSQQQWIEYLGAWQTERERVLELPPTLSPSRCKPQCRVAGVREKLRRQLRVERNAWIWLAIGVQPRTKGLDRVLRALRHFPRATLLIAGLNDNDVAAERAAGLVRRLGISQRVIWLGHREDIERVCAACDVLVHPARYDTTGTVILEALVNGLPVITTSACGYAKHVHAAGAGIVLEDPFDFKLFLTAIKDMADSARRSAYSAAGIAYGRNENLCHGRALAAQMLTGLAEHKQHKRSNDSFPWSLPSDNAASNNVISLRLTDRR
jgi:UDP-glucose:(heptosyl)LPS alpha-1,3-glucosyltransferase